METSRPCMLLVTLSAVFLGATVLSAKTSAFLRLDGEESLMAIITEPLLAVLADEADLEIVNGDAAEGGKLVLTCRVRCSGYRITARIVDAEDRSVITLPSLTGREDEIFEVIDQLGQRLADAVSSGDSDKHRVAVLDFGNDAGADSEPLASGLPDMLTMVMRQGSQLTLLERGDIRRGAQHSRSPSHLSADAAAELSGWLGADVAVTGILTDLLDIQLEVTNAEGKLLESARRIGPRTALVDLMARLASDLGPDLDSGIPGNRMVAILPFANHGEDRFDALVRGLPDMLTTTLGQAAKLTVIERVQIDNALRNFNLEMSGPIDSETVVQVGAWLGADAIILGSFLRFGRVFRLDARMIDAKTGEVMIAQSARGGEDEVLAMVDSLGRQLQQRFDEKETTDNVGMGSLRVAFRTVKSEMGERPLYNHICKMYVDGDFVGLSPIVVDVDKWTTLFDKNLRRGPHRVQIVHGYVRDGAWDGPMPKQPRQFHPTVESGGMTTVKYTFDVGWFSDSYVYEP